MMHVEQMDTVSIIHWQPIECAVKHECNQVGDVEAPTSFETNVSLLLDCAAKLLTTDAKDSRDTRVYKTSKVS